MSDWLRRRVLRWLFPDRGHSAAAMNNHIRQMMAELRANMKPLDL